MMSDAAKLSDSTFERAIRASADLGRLQGETNVVTTLASMARGRDANIREFVADVIAKLNEQRIDRLAQPTVRPGDSQ